MANIKINGILFTAALSEKILTIRIVSRCSWIEFSVWKTSRSCLKGWSAEFIRRAGSFRVITPIVGFATCVCIE